MAVAPDLQATNAIAGLQRGVRKSIRNKKGHFASGEAPSRPIWLALRNLKAKGKNPPNVRAWANAQCAIQFGERFRLDDCLKERAHTQNL